MKKILILSFLVLFAFGSLNFTAEAKTVRVKGYYKKSGTYVMPSYRTSPNKNKFDNYSTKGNYNPYSGKKGTVNPYKIKY